MKHIYESEVLYKLMERDGFNIPSSVPPYEAEIKAYLINQVKQAYPKLTDYEAEWLLYNYTKHLPADFPISSVSDVTKATFENVVPFAYQSAILTGQTLVNLFNVDDSLSLESLNSRWKYQNRVLNLIGGNTYYVYFFNKLNNLPIHIKPINTVGEKGAFNVEANTGKVVTLDSTITGAFGYYYYKDGWTRGESKQDIIDKCKILFIEYQEGMENWDIPYFEGMQSVKMPVLTTTGKNIFKASNNSKLGGLTFTVSSNNYLVNGTCNQDNMDFYLISLTTNVDIYQKLNSLPIGTKISVSKNNNVGKQMFLRIEKKDGSPTQYTQKYTTTDNDKNIQCFVRFMKGDAFVDANMNFQVEINNEPSSYEPFKSNILSASDDVTLRGIGNVKDALDCLTGELTERIKTTTLDKFTKWSTHPNVSEGFSHFTTNITDISTIPHALLCDSLPAGNIVDVYNGTSEGLYHSGNKYLHITIKTDKLSENNANGLNQYLKDNIITIQYPLETESIKTVDLTTVNEKGETVYFMPLEGTMHVSCTSEAIQPTFDMSVPVEATTQNLASFIDLEMEE